MKVLLVNGSPHEKGCTAAALKEVAQTLEQEGIETEIFWIGNQIKGGCIACKSCAKTGRCALDDAVNVCLEKAESADGFVFASPVHYAAISGNMTGFMDRLFYSESNGRGNKDFYLKPAAAVLSARRAGTTAAFDQMNKYFTIQEMPVVSSRYWNMVHGTNPAEVAQDLEGMQMMRTLGRNMAWLLKSIDAGRREGLSRPVTEPRVKTNFVR